jgi:membrane-associated protein
MDFFWNLFHQVYDVEFLVRAGGLGLLTIIVFVETGLLIGFFLPGDSLLVTAGIFAANGSLDLLTLNVTLSAAAIAGDTVGYRIGYVTGPKIFSRENSLLFHRKHLLSAKEFYDRHGGFTIVIARFIPIIRTFAPVVAGVGAMSYRRFLAFNIFGGVFWVMATTLAGYFLGTLIPNVQEQIHLVIAIVIFLSLLPGIIKFFNHWRKTRSRVGMD